MGLDRARVPGTHRRQRDRGDGGAPPSPEPLTENAARSSSSNSVSGGSRRYHFGPSGDRSRFLVRSRGDDQACCDLGAIHVSVCSCPGGCRAPTARCAPLPPLGPVKGACPGGLPAARVVPAGGRRPCACVHPSMSVFTIGETMTPWIARGIPCCVTSTTFEFPSPTDIDHIVAAGDTHEFRRSA